MKKAIALLLALTMILSMTACGKTEAAKEKGKEAYDQLTEAYTMTDMFGDDLYNLWADALNNSSAYKKDPLQAFMKNVSGVDQDTIKLGILCATAEVASAKENKEKVVDTFTNYTEEERAKLLEGIEDSTLSTVFVMVSNVSAFSIIVLLDAYKISGTVSAIQQNMEEVKEQIKELETEYPDFEGLAALKSIYATTSSYLDFCLDPKGSILQAADTLTGFRTSVKTSMGELELIF